MSVRSYGTAVVIGLCLLLPDMAFAQQDASGQTAPQAEDLAKASQNPLGDMISVPLEFYHNDGENGTSFSIVSKPLIPVRVGNVSLVNRFVVSWLSVDGILRPPDQNVDGPVVDVSGLANTTWQGYLGPTKPGKLLWGLGPALEIPTATNDQLGADRWSIGPSLLLVTMPGHWVLGTLAQQIWDFAGSGDEDVNRMTLQLIANYNLSKGWYVSSVPVIVADWTADEDDVWTVPLGGGVGKMVRIGSMPLDLKATYYYNVVKPSLGADWSLMFSVKMLFAK